MIQAARSDTPTFCRPTLGPLAIVLLFTALLQVGCAGPWVNPSFPLSVKRAETELLRMQREPKEPARPILVLGGWGDFLGLPPAYLAEQLRLATGNDSTGVESTGGGGGRVISVSFGGCATFDQCRQRVIERVQEAFPSDEAGLTVEFDVVGYSMGGLVARYAAAPMEGDDGPLTRLRIARLYTISTPHRGARIAKFAVSSSLGKDMLADSDFLRRLDEQWISANYPIVPYVRLGDAIVGASNASPPHLTPRWLPRRPFSRSHNDAYRDPRFIADIARRLRDETPYTTEPVEAVPEDVE